MFAIFILLSFIIGLNAVNAKIQYDINKINREISDTQKEIQMLQVKIKTAANITNLESRAMALGLKYPDYSQIVYLEPDEEDEVADLALALCENAYRDRGQKNEKKAVIPQRLK